MTDLEKIKSKVEEYEQTSIGNEGLREEFDDMDMLGMNFLAQIVITDTSAKLWFKFNDGKVDWGEGDAENPSLTFSTSLSTFTGIIFGEVEISGAHEAGDVSFDGGSEALMDLQAITSVINEFLQTI